VSVAFVAYWLGHAPSARIICASYGQDLADKHARDCRALMESDWYQRVFRTRLASQRQSIGEFTTSAQGFRMATSVSGVLTGRGADVRILDDILKPDLPVIVGCDLSLSVAYFCMRPCVPVAGLNLASTATPFPHGEAFSVGRTQLVPATSAHISRK
jgi:hypothetical protein